MSKAANNSIQTRFIAGCRGGQE